MENEQFYGAAYKGSKSYNQWDLKTADATGFGAAADDYMERGIDLNEQLIQNKPATFFMRMRGDAMIGAGIHDSDVVVVDRSLKPQSGRVVIAVLNGEMLIRRLERTINKVRLIPENKRFAATEVDPSCDTLEFWGVVTYAIHAL
ncbi:MAG: translesion error-prone DNA polymerase V autoproteolytic subunit [Candidatus Pseudobacter hemicellulosilyticus]|uniref:Translesion error-prone DNA polymerase V autoproteolytic subunit n=1 Tax=Candidatus Pseudobacter hemicellulosilyticus TaxID=3121375 RepID=A0AAJ6BI63_9BACT|nr:MAG: translesion error-prone DNA polymerase V autoproteolytic subunit [Pseudobacter sp.]